MSPLQYGTMRYIINNEPLERMARLIKQTTLSSLFYRKWVQLEQRKDGRHIIPTADGVDSVEMYSQAKYARRVREMDLTPTVQRYIHYRVVSINRRREVA